MLNLILVLPILVVLLQGAALYLQTQRLLQLRFRYPKYEVQSLRDLPIALKQAFTPAIAELKALGFEISGTYRMQKMLHLAPADDRAVLLYHPESKTFAEVEIRFPADSSDLIHVSFYQILADQRWLITLNGQAHGVIDQIPQAIIVDPYCTTIAQQWAAHQAKFASFGQVAQRLTPNQFITALQKHQQHYVDHLLAQRIVKVTREGWFLANRSALKTAWQIRRAQRQVSQRLSQRQAFLAARQTVPLPLQIQTFQRLRALETNHRDLRLGKWIFLVTLGLFVLLAIVLPQTLGTFKAWDLLLLLSVLLIHELGHFFAMRWFGYQDTKLFFLPLFGAAVTGKKADASLTEKVWVLLAGPLPGLLLGLGLMASLSAQLLPTKIDAKAIEHAAWMLISLNLLNLLPIYPLDGGKIANHLLFSRYPWTDVLFKGVTVLLFGLCSAISPTFLILAIGTAISIPNSYRTAQLNLVIQRQLAQLKRSNDFHPADLLPIVFQEMQSAGYGQLPWSKRDTIAKELLDRQREQIASAASRWGLAGIYAGSLMLGLVGTVAAVLPQIPNQVAAAPNSPSEFDQAFRQANRQIQRQPRSATAYFQRARLYEQRYARSQNPAINVIDHPQPRSTGPSRDLQQALTDYNQAIKLNPHQTASYQARAHLQRLLGQPAAALADYNALIRLNPQDPTRYSDRAELHYHLGQHQAAIQDANAALKLNPHQPDTYQIRAQAKQAIGDHSGAQADQQQATQLWQALN